MGHPFKAPHSLILLLLRTRLHGGGWRPIYYPLAPYGSGINDFINVENYTLSLCSVNDAIAALSKGTLMAKIDLNASKVMS